MAQRRQPNNKQPKPAAKPQTVFDKRAIITDALDVAFMQDNRKAWTAMKFVLASSAAEATSSPASRRSGAPAPRP